MPTYSLFSIWRELPFIPKLFLLVLFVVGVYSFASAAKILFRLRSLASSGRSEDNSALRTELATLSARSANTRQLITASFYLFGMIFFWSLRFTLWTPESKTIPVGFYVLENFFLYFAFAANAFLVFLILHSVQWFVSARLQRCARSFLITPTP
jgi:hypothetical protein